MLASIYSLVTVLISTPFQWVVYLMEVGFQSLNDSMVLVVMSFLLGMMFLLLVQGLILLSMYRDQPVAPPPVCQRASVKLPEVLRNRLGQQYLKKKEDCVWLNLLMHFLFVELRDSINVRRFLTKKIHKEFEELLTSRTGVFMDELLLRDFSLGDKCPVFTGIFVDRCDMKKDVIETLDIRTHMAYDGGFEIAIDAALPFGRTAFISVRVMKLKGNMRFQFCNTPFCHWSMSFYEEPEIELDVSAQLDGRPMYRLKNIIGSQLQRTLRKKHTLPMYKIRYKPFFQPKVERPLMNPQNLMIDGIQIGSGILEISVIGASKLPVINKDAKLYCTVSVDDMPWKQLVTKERSKKPLLRKELVKHLHNQSLGLTVKDDLVPDRLHPVVVVEKVVIGSPAHLASIKEGDIIITVSGNKVSSAKQATKFLRSAKDKVSLQVETSCDDSEVKMTRSDDHLEKRSFDSDSEEENDEFSNAKSTISCSASTASVPTSNIPSSHAKSKKWDVRKTKMVSSFSNPSWGQKFIFTLQPNISFLNICVWSHGGDRSGRTDVIGSSSQDILIGHASINLDDILLHCLATLSGTFQDKVRLKHGQYQTEAELTKQWASHKGWDPELMYGETILGFYFIPSLLTTAQRRSLASCRRDSNLKTTVDIQAHSSPGNGSPKKDTLESPSVSSSLDDSQTFSQGHHQFDSTSFITATFCDYCGKKIWMKEAFKCRTCSMICHKKCLVKCLVNTFCTDDGVKKRNAQDEKWEPFNRHKMTHPNVNPLDPHKHQRSTSDGAKQAVPKRSNDSAASSQATGAPIETLQDEENTFGRFRTLKEKTNRIKENVVRNLKKTKFPLTLSDKDVIEAKDSGAKLFLEMEPSQRKDKLDEMITHLDEQLKIEMSNKESLEKELESSSELDQGAGHLSLRKKSEIRGISVKITKSTEKLDAMRLLMLQYCTALQHSINMLEGGDDESIVMESAARMNRSTPESTRSASSSNTVTEMVGVTQDSSTSGTGRVAYMGDFMKRASSSVKEKMSLIRKDFTKKGQIKPPQASSIDAYGLSPENTKDGRNNNHTSSTQKEDDSSSLVNKMSPGIAISKREMKASVDDLDNFLTMAKLTGADGVDKTGEQRSHSLPRIQVQYGEESNSIYVCDISKPNHSEIPSSRTLEDNVDHMSIAGQKILRSSSDSHLEMEKTVNLDPNDGLLYRGNSLPKILVSDEENSESGFLVIDSSDETDMSDFYDEQEMLRVVTEADNCEPLDSCSMDTSEVVVNGSKLFNNDNQNAGNDMSDRISSPIDNQSYSV